MIILKQIHNNLKTMLFTFLVCISVQLSAERIKDIAEIEVFEVTLLSAMG